MTNATLENSRFYVRVSNAITGKVKECRGFYPDRETAQKEREKAWQDYYSQRHYITITIEKE